MLRDARTIVLSVANVNVFVKDDLRLTLDNDFLYSSNNLAQSRSVLHLDLLALSFGAKQVGTVGLFSRVECGN